MSRAYTWPAWFIHLLAPLLILLPVLWALLPGGLPNSADYMVHFARIIEIVLSWRDGILIPRWSLNLGFGYGIPVFVFGPPLAYWLGAMFNMVGLEPESAYKAMLVTTLVISAAGMYRLGQALLGVWAGVVATVAFVYAPNQLFTLFVQGNAPQLLAWSFVPWSLWAVIQLYDTSGRREQFAYVLVLAFAVGATLMSHNVVSLVLVPTVALLAVTLWVATQRHRALWLVVVGGVLGSMMGAWFAMPALLEMDNASTDLIRSFDYRLYFVPLTELLAWPPRIDTAAINPYIPRTLGLPQVVVALMGVVLLVSWPLVRRVKGAGSGTLPSGKMRGRVFWATALFMTLYALFCGWMATSGSAPLWKNISILEFLQFPSRWIGFAGYALAWLAAVGVALLPRGSQRFAAGALSLLLLGSALVNLYPDKLPPDTRSLSAYEVVRYEVRSGAIGTTSYGEFNPRWAPRPLPPSLLVDDYLAQRPVDRLEGVLPEGASSRTLEVNAHHQRYEIVLPAATTLSFNLLYFPGWRATVNGSPVEIWPQEATGLVTLALPAGESVVELVFGPTPLRRWVGLLSAIAWTIFGVGVVWSLRGRFVAAGAELLPQTGQLFAVTGGVVGVTLLLLAFGAPWFMLHSGPDQAAAASIQRHEDVGERLRLLGQEPLPATVRAGEKLPVVAYWRALVDLDVNYMPVLAVVEAAGRRPLVEMDKAHPSNIPTSGWATGLYVRDQWSVQIPTDALPVQYALLVNFRHPQTGEMLPAAAGVEGIELGRFWVVPRRAPQPPAGPRIRFGNAVTLLGATTQNDALTLYWRAESSTSADYRLFVHLLGENNVLLGQLDGLPFDNRYPVWAWLPGQTIEDRREIAQAGIDANELRAIAVGMYNAASGERLAAIDAQGQPLPDNALVIEWRAE
jgi:hypothetical protein